MAAEPGETQEEARAGGSRVGSAAFEGAGQKEQDEGREDGSGGDVEPGDSAEETAAAEADSGEDGTGSTAAPVAAERVAGKSGESVENHPVAVQVGGLEIAVVEREEQEEQSEREEWAGLGLADERLAGPDGGVPQREMAEVELPGLELEPGNFYGAHVWVVEPGEFVRERQLPEKDDDKEKEA